MSWPIVLPGQDDGTAPTHFSYEWSPWREESQAALKLGLLPEIHVWVGLPDQNELLDFATKFLPDQAAKEGSGLADTTAARLPLVRPFRVARGRPV